VSDSGLTSAGLIDAPDLARLNERRDAPGWRQLGLHLAVLLAGLVLWGAPRLGLPPGPEIPWPLQILGLMLLGTGLAFAFCAMHECGHRTAFASRPLNDAVAWWAGLLSFYNADFYRRYHQWHHRWTHQIGLDPELEDAPPTTVTEYLLELSGLPWWLGKLRGHWAGLAGDFAGRPYIPAEAGPAITASLRRQFALYGALLLASLPGANGAILWLWLLPLAVGQPLLRFVLMAEHQGCDYGPDGLTNTRTTLTLAPLRRLMWNMPFHSEHHLYPSLPFHALAAAHRRLAPRLGHCEPGYLAVHRRLLANLAALAPPPAAVAAAVGTATAR
jgi:fatty acid desaturase